VDYPYENQLRCEENTKLRAEINEQARPLGDSAEANEIADNALAIKPDSSARRPHDNALIERCAQGCVALERPDCWAAKECTLNIRLLKDPS